MIEPLHSLDDFRPGPKQHTGTDTGWKFIHYDREAGQAIMQVVSQLRETVVHYPAEPENVALIIDAETLEIVGVQIEDYDPKALR